MILIYPKQIGIIQQLIRYYYYIIIAIPIMFALWVIIHGSVITLFTVTNAMHHRWYMVWPIPLMSAKRQFNVPFTYS